MLTVRPPTTHTPFSKQFKNENNYASSKRPNFPKTPLASIKHLEPSTNNGKGQPQSAAHPRKALLDKTPGTHLLNRTKNVDTTTTSIKPLVLVLAQSPSASRKSKKAPRISAEFKTPDPSTRKPHWDISDNEISEDVVQPPVLEDTDDFDEPEYMPPRSKEPSVALDYDFLPNVAELGRLLARPPPPSYWEYEDPPEHFEEPFFVPEEHLAVPLRSLSPDLFPWEIEQQEKGKSKDNARILRSHTPKPTATKTTTAATKSNATRRAASAIGMVSTSRTRSITTTRPVEPKQESLSFVTNDVWFDDFRFDV